MVTKRHRSTKPPLTSGLVFEDQDHVDFSDPKTQLNTRWYVLGDPSFLCEGRMSVFEVNNVRVRVSDGGVLGTIISVTVPSTFSGQGSCSHRGNRFSCVRDVCPFVFQECTHM